MLDYDGSGTVGTEEFCDGVIKAWCSAVGKQLQARAPVPHFQFPDSLKMHNIGALISAFFFLGGGGGPYYNCSITYPKTLF